MSFIRLGFLVAAALGVGSAALATPAAAQGALATAVPARPADGVLLHQKTYIVPAPIDMAWEAWTDPAKRETWFGRRGGGAKPAEASATRYLQRGVVDHPGLPGATEMTVTMAPVEGGTAVTQTMIGLGGKDVWRNSVDPGGGIAEMMGDFALYLRTGAGFPRHTHVALRSKRAHPNDFMAGARDFPGGVKVLEVPAGTLGAQAGMQPGDVLVALNDTGIYSLRDLDVARLGLAPGDHVEVAWIRGDKVMRGTGRATHTPIRWRNGFDPAKFMKGRDESQEHRQWLCQSKCTGGSVGEGRAL